MSNTPVPLNDREDGILLVAKDVGDQVAIGPIRMAHVRETAIYAVWSKDAMGGTLIIESAHHPGYAGQWHPLGEIAWVDKDSVQQRGYGGIHLAVRIRLTEPVENGTVTVYGIAN